MKRRPLRIPSRLLLLTACLAALCAAACGSDSAAPDTDTRDGGSLFADAAKADGDAADVAADTTAVDALPFASCSSDSDCAPSTLTCREAFCDAGFCATRPAQGVQTCDDGNQCTTGDQCKAGSCVGTPKVCSDGNECTEDLCDALKGCQNSNVVKPCKTDELCIIHGCVAGQCTIIDSQPCDDANPCTADSCKPKVGCQYKPLSNTLCSDDDSCTEKDICKFGTCKGIGKPCSDGNACTTDGCDGKQDCFHIPNSKPCSDGSLCTTGDACNDGACSGKVKGCDDGSPCTTDACDSKTGLCVNLAISDGTPCDDGNACTSGDNCVGVLCKAGPLKSCEDGNPCTVDACSPDSGGCVSSAVADGVACVSTDLCLTGATCQAGTCSGGVPVLCQGSSCQLSVCDPATGSCVSSNSADGTPCGDGLACQAGVCQ
jgi:hypothetical protein